MNNYDFGADNKMMETALYILRLLVCVQRGCLIGKWVCGATYRLLKEKFNYIWAILTVLMGNFVKNLILKQF